MEAVPRAIGRHTILSRLRNLYGLYKAHAEQEKIERYSEIIAHVQISGTIPNDITTKEFDEIALWDAIAIRAERIVEQHKPAAVGTVSMDDLKGE